MLRIINVSRSAVPRSGGIEAHLDRVSRGLVAKGHAVRTYAARIDDKPFTRMNTTLTAQAFHGFTAGGVETLPLPLTALRRAWMLPAAASALPGADRLGYHRLRSLSVPLIERSFAPGLSAAFAGADIVHAWGGELLMHAVKAAARTRPFVVTPFAHPGHWGDDDLNARLYTRADLVIALLPGEASFYETLGVHHDRVRVIPVAAPEPHHAPVLPQETGDGPLVLSLGVKRRYKYQALLEAIPSIKGSDVRFAFVGPETPESEHDFAAFRDPRIIRAGKVGEAEKWGWLAAADVLCLPSVSEILPVSILEAWQMSTAVVVAEGRFTRDLVGHGENGIVCAQDRIAEAITEALADRDRLRAMGKAGAATVAATYRPDLVVAAHEQAYRSLA